MNDTQTDIPGIKHLWRWQENLLVTSAGEVILTADTTETNIRQLTLLAASPFLYRFLAALLQEWQKNPLGIASWIREHSVELRFVVEQADSGYRGPNQKTEADLWGELFREVLDLVNSSKLVKDLKALAIAYYRQCAEKDGSEALQIEAERLLPEVL